jgi:hypothetical protein
MVAVTCWLCALLAWRAAITCCFFSCRVHNLFGHVYYITTFLGLC